MAITESEKTSILNEIRSESQDITELRIATSLEGVGSLPAMEGNELVSVPIDLLSQPAVIAAAHVDDAKQAAMDAARDANAATASAITAIANADSATAQAAQATQAANTAAATAQESAHLADVAAEGARTLVEQQQGINEQLAASVNSKGVIWDEEADITQGSLVSYKGILYRALRSVSPGGANPCNNPDYLRLTQNGFLMVSEDLYEDLKANNGLDDDVLYLIEEEE